MTITLEIPAGLEEQYRAEAQSRGLEVEDVVREVLVRHSSERQGIGGQGAGREGLGLFGSAEDSALLDEAVALALAERRQPSRRV
jgi:hypothetical protein